MVLRRRRVDEQGWIHISPCGCIPPSPMAWPLQSSIPYLLSLGSDLRNGCDEDMAPSDMNNDYKVRSFQHLHTALVIIHLVPHVHVTI
jgi:hypothetical protein